MRASILALALVVLHSSLSARAEGEAIDEVSTDLSAVGGGIRLERSVTMFGDRTVERFVLDNGLVVVYLRDPSAAVFSIQTWVRVGSRHERIGHTGIAHLFEHLMFRATSNHPDGAYDRLFEERGCETNADTWADRTRYYEDLRTEFLEFACEMEADRLMNLVLDQETFTSELDVVKNERRQSVDNDPWGKMDEEWTARLFGRDHPYGWPTLGWMSDLDAMTLEAAADFYHTYYAPNAVTLVIVGDLSRRDVLAAVKRHYGGLTPSELSPSEDPPAPSAASVPSSEITLDFANERLMTGWLGPTVRDSDFTAFELAIQILFGEEKSRWWERVVRDEPIATEVSAWVAPFAFAGCAQLTASLLPDHSSEEAEHAALAILGSVLDGSSPIRDEELEGARRRLQIATWMALETAHGKAEFLAEAEVVLGGLEAGERRLRAVASVTLDDLHAALARYCTAPRRATLHARPPVPEDEPANAATELPLGALAGPGGSVVVVEADPTLPLVSVRIALRDGAAADPPGLPGLTAFAGDAVSLGAGGLPRAEIESALRQLGSGFDCTVHRDSVVFGGTMLAGDVERWLAVVAMILLEPDFPDSELAKLRAEHLAQLESLPEDDRAHAQVTFDRALFGESSYGRSIGGTPGSLAVFTREHLERWHESLHGGDFVFAASGATTAAVFAQQVSLAFAELPAGPRRPPPPPPQPRPLGGGLDIALVDQPERTQARWILGWPAEGWTQAPFEALTIANTTLGGTFKARLNDKLRVEHGWTYGAYSQFEPGRSLGTFRVSAATATDVTLPALQRTLELLDTWGTGDITPEELSATRSYLANARPFEIDTARERLSERLTGILENLPADYYPGLLDRLAGVDLDGARDAAKRCQARSGRGMVLVVLGNAAELREGLEELKRPGDRLVVLPGRHLGPIPW